MWQLASVNMFDSNGKWNDKGIQPLLNDGYEPFATATNTTGSGGGSFLCSFGDVSSQIILLFRKQQEVKPC